MAILRLEYERRIRRWSQVKLAEKSRIPQKDISLIERGRLIPTEQQLVNLANALKITPASVLMNPTVLQTDEEMDALVTERESARV